MEKRSYRQYYNVIANPLLWFVQHQLWDVPRKPTITRETWDAWREGYVNINRQFAHAVADSIGDTDRPVVILPQDYQLYLVPGYVRELLGDRVQIQPFIHIPWPGPDAWRILPADMREELLVSLLAANRVGFQTVRDAFNFVQTCRFYLRDAHSQGSRDSIHYNGRKIEARSYPISISVDEVLGITEEPETKLLKYQLISNRRDYQLILRVDRIEPSKNILRGLKSYRALLEAYPQHRGKVQMVALLVPSRMEVTEYQSYLSEIMAESGILNALFSDESWEPVRIILGSNYRRAIAAMQLYHVLLVNPIVDGMNLVAKEGALVNQQDGVLVLSENAGVVYELGEHALVVSPYDVHSTAEALHRALTMPEEERRQRAQAMRQQVENADVNRWFYMQLEDALRAFNSQARNDSTPATPEAVKSDSSSTASGTPSDSTPSPTA
jgi:trehalose 6-phosphate synthase